MTETDDLEQQAYAAFDAGDLATAAGWFRQLLAGHPHAVDYHYMLGLAHKYLGEWAPSLASNLQAVACDDEFNEAAWWNAGIAATALGDWVQARRAWAACGIPIPAGEGEIATDFGVAAVRLNPWAKGETVFVRRIDPVRARILNVPLPESGYCFGDVVLHDGAPTGERFDGGRPVPVFNVLARWRPSAWPTFSAFVHCPAPEDVAALQAVAEAGGGYAEDWSASLQILCRRCSYGLPHGHHEHHGDDGWQPQRDIGLAASNLAEAEAWLHAWQTAAPGRRLEGLDSSRYPVPAAPAGVVWWQGGDETDEAGETGEQAT